MIKQKIVICSLQKPVDEPRMLHRLAFSLGQTNEYDIKIIGFPSKNVKKIENIILSPLFDDAAKYPTRIKLLLLAYKQLNESPPTLLIICTHELLELGLWMKMRYGTKLIYDVQENYPLNILFMSRIKSSLIKKSLSKFIQWRQKCHSPWIDLFILAEKCYQYQLDFIQNRFILFENKVELELINKFIEQKSASNDSNFIISITGTISSLYGLREILNITNIFSTHSNVYFHIMGHAPIPEDKTLLEKLSLLSNVKVKTSSNPIPYDEILNQIAQSDAILSIQSPNPAIEGKLPSKMFEAAVLKKVILVRKDLSWSDFVQKNGLGLVFDYQDLDPERLIQSLSTYTNTPLSIEQYVINSHDKLTLIKAIKEIK